MIELGFVVGAVILVSAFCSMCEAALYSVPVSHIETLVAKKSRTGKLIKALREEVDRPITAILSLNTIANTAGAAVAGALAARALGDDWVVAFSALFTVAILLFSEVLPKTVGVVYSRAVAGLIALPLHWMVRIFTPVIWACGLVTRLITGGARQDEVKPEEIVVMARLGQQSGTLEEDEVEVIQNILSVRGKSVREIMTPRNVLYSLDAETTIDEASKSERLYNHSRVPVYVGDASEIIGVVHRRDILAAIADKKNSASIREYMKPVNFVLDSLKLDRLLDRFLERRQHLFVVLNEFNDMAGVVTLEDVLEEILGEEIVDEFDEVVDMQELARRRRSEVIAHQQPRK